MWFFLLIAASAVWTSGFLFGAGYRLWRNGD